MTASVAPMLAFQASMPSDLPVAGVVLASLLLVATAVALSRWMRLKIERDLIIATVRAAVQLLIVGLVFSVLFGSRLAIVWAWIWVAAMVTIAASVVVRRTNHEISGMAWVGVVVIGGSTAIGLAIVFGFGVIEFGPVSLIVISGITIGNAMPSTVLGANQAVSLARDRLGEIEATLALGFDRAAVSRYLAPRAAREALIPQIERTKVVGLIALPGAMTGLLLAGVAPLDAVIIQLVIMYVILGASAVCVVAVVATVCRAVVTAESQLAQWVRSRQS